MAFTTSLQNSLLNEVFRNVEYTQPTTVWAALFTTATDINGNGTEVTGGSYARQQITFSAAANGIVSNSTTITFPTPTASWGTVTHFAIMSASTAGTMLAQGQLGSSKLINTGEVYTMSSGDIVVGLS